MSMSGVRRNCLTALVVAVVCTADWWTSAVAMTAETARQSRVTFSPEDQSLTVLVEGVIPLNDLVGEIAREIDAQVIIRRDSGTVGPITIDGLSLPDAIRLISGRHSWALEYRAGRVVRIVLVAARGGSASTHRPVIAGAPRLPVQTSAFRQASEAKVSTRKAKALRDIIKLSYRRDGGAVDDLAAIVASNDDPELRGAAISALAGAGGARAAQLIATQGMTDRDVRVRLRAAEGVWRTGGINASRQLRAAARSDRDPQVRMAIERLLSDGLAPGSDTGGPHPAQPAR